jgi:hypothetical protein
VSKGEPGGLEVTGPLASFEVGFRAQLERMGYRPRSARGLVRAMAGLSGWLEETGLPPGALTPRVVADVRLRFLILARCCGFCAALVSFPKLTTLPRTRLSIGC